MDGWNCTYTLEVVRNQALLSEAGVAAVHGVVADDDPGGATPAGITPQSVKMYPRHSENECLRTYVEIRNAAMNASAKVA